MTQEVILTDEMKTHIRSISCFSAAAGVTGTALEGFQTYVDPSLHLTVFCVVTMRNNETFIGHTTCRKHSVFNYTTACEKAKNKALRKMLEHCSKQLIGTLI